MIVTHLPWIDRIIVTDTDTIRYSDDGGATFSVSSAIQSNLNLFVVGGNFVLARHDTTPCETYKSTDGITWALTTNVFTYGHTLEAERLKFAVGHVSGAVYMVEWNSCYKTVNGTDWTALTFPTNFSGWRAWYANGLLILYGEEISTGWMVFQETSDEGGAWVKRGSYSGYDSKFVALRHDGTNYWFGGYSSLMTGANLSSGTLVATGTDTTSLRFPEWHDDYLVGIKSATGADVVATKDRVTLFTERPDPMLSASINSAQVFRGGVHFLHTDSGTGTTYIYKVFGKGAVLGPVSARLGGQASAVATATPPVLYTATRFAARAVNEVVAVTLPPGSTTAGIKSIVATDAGFFALSSNVAKTGLRSPNGVNWVSFGLVAYDGYLVDAAYSDAAALDGLRIATLAYSLNNIYQPSGVVQRSDDQFLTRIAQQLMPADTVGQHALYWSALAVNANNRNIAVAISANYDFAATNYFGDWSVAMLPTLTQHYWADVEYGNGGFLTIASNGGSATPKFARSIDDVGSAWAATSTLPLGAAWESVAWGPSGFVVVGILSGTVRTLNSPTGDGSWVAYNTGISAVTAKIEGFSDRYMLVTPTNAYTSKNGIAWTPLSLAASLGTPYRGVAARLGGVYVIGASASDTINVVRYCGGHSIAQADLTVVNKFRSDAYAVATASALVWSGVATALSAAVAAVATVVDPALTTRIRFDVLAGGWASALAELATEILVRGTAAASVAVSANLTARIRLNGVLGAEAVASAEITVRMRMQVSGEAICVSAVSANLNTKIILTATVSAVASCWGAAIGTKTSRTKRAIPVTAEAHPLCVGAYDAPIHVGGRQ